MQMVGTAWPVVCRATAVWDVCECVEGGGTLREWDTWMSSVLQPVSKVRLISRVLSCTLASVLSCKFLFLYPAVRVGSTPLTYLFRTNDTKSHVAVCVFYWFPRWLSSKESACQAGDMGSVPGSGRSPEERNGNPIQYSCLGNPMDRGAWQVTAMGLQKNQT